jgi:solute:Na+ symporter, SSS family
MKLYFIDWAIILAFFAVSLAIGLFTSRTAKKGFSEFFLSGRNLPWWLLGVSMVATTFSADTPNLVTDIVRKQGISGNWVWWAFLLTGMLTTFIYARLWRKSGISTDLEFYELRYSGKGASFLRIFRALYLGIFFNSVIMATVLLAGIKLGAVFLGISAFQSIFFISIVTLVYSVLGGFKGVILTDFFQFFLAMIGALYAASIAIEHTGLGCLSNVLSHPNVSGHTGFLPDFSNWENALMVFIIPIAVQWWSVWYPGSEPGGGGYIAQRILASKTEKDSIKASLFFNLAHYALRPWPWIIVALASMVVFPDLDSLQKAFPDVPPEMVHDDMAYPAMLSFLPRGWAGLVLASLIAALMSTISTHLNWGSSYLVLDVYKRFIKADASEKSLVNIGRLSIVFLMLMATIIALLLSHALEAFHILLQIGAGTGLIFILRWFWWRINAWSEITAMVVSFLVALYFQFWHTSLGFEELSTGLKLIFGIGITTIAWVFATLITPPVDRRVLESFVEKINPGGPGWKRFRKEEISNSKWHITKGLRDMALGAISIYSLLFGIGYLLFDRFLSGFIFLALGIGLMYFIWKQLNSPD